MKNKLKPIGNGTRELQPKAVEQLGSEKIEVRCGGIYTLERISRESADDHWPVIETLTAFVRERARWRPNQEKLPTDIDAAITVIARRRRLDRRREANMGRRLDLRSTNLRGAILERGQLEEAILVGAYLEGAILEGTHLQGSDLRGAIGLEGDNLRERTAPPRQGCRTG